VRAIECLRRLLRRSGEALVLLQLICQHNVARLVQTLGNDLRRKLVQLTFHQLVCSEDGDQLAMRLISSLMEVALSSLPLLPAQSANKKATPLVTIHSFLFMSVLPCDFSVLHWSRGQRNC
jgi:hypothetical protein